MSTSTEDSTTAAHAIVVQHQEPAPAIVIEDDDSVLVSLPSSVSDDVSSNVSGDHQVTSTSTSTPSTSTLTESTTSTVALLSSLPVLQYHTPRARSSSPSLAVPNAPVKAKASRGRSRSPLPATPTSPKAPKTPKTPATPPLRSRSASPEVTDDTDTNNTNNINSHTNTTTATSNSSTHSRGGEHKGHQKGEKDNDDKKLKRKDASVYQQQLNEDHDSPLRAAVEELLVNVYPLEASKKKKKDENGNDDEEDEESPADYDMKKVQQDKNAMKLLFSEPHFASPLALVLADVAESSLCDKTMSVADKKLSKVLLDINNAQRVHNIIRFLVHHCSPSVVEELQLAISQTSWSKTQEYMVIKQERNWNPVRMDMSEMVSTALHAKSRYLSDLVQAEKKKEENKKKKAEKKEAEKKATKGKDGKESKKKATATKSKAFVEVNQTLEYLLLHHCNEKLLINKTTELQFRQQVIATMKGVTEAADNGLFGGWMLFTESWQEFLSTLGKRVGSAKRKMNAEKKKEPTEKSTVIAQENKARKAEAAVNVVKSTKSSKTSKNATSTDDTTTSTKSHKTGKSGKSNADISNNSRKVVSDRGSKKDGSDRNSISQVKRSSSSLLATSASTHHHRRDQRDDYITPTTSTITNSAAKTKKKRNRDSDSDDSDASDNDNKHQDKKNKNQHQSKSRSSDSDQSDDE